MSWFDSFHQPIAKLSALQRSMDHGFTYSMLYSEKWFNKDALVYSGEKRLSNFQKDPLIDSLHFTNYERSVI